MTDERQGRPHAGPAKDSMGNSPAEARNATSHPVPPHEIEPLPIQTEQRILVETTRPELRLDSFLKESFPTFSRGAMQRMIADGDIRVNGARVKPTHTPRAGDVVDICWRAPRPATAQPQEIPLDILFEDADLLVLNKAPGIAVHPSAGHEERTLVNALLHHCAGQLSGIGGTARPGIVHRLDLDTSGCLVVAKNDPTHLALAGQFARREVHKVYEAVVCGRMATQTGEIRAAIARHPNHRKRMAVTSGKGRAAWTSYRVLACLHEATLVEAVLHTGRTHQIRVHFHFIGHPLLGDATYGRRQNAHVSEITSYTAPRQLLHARTIELRHPRTGLLLRIDAPQPADIARAIQTLSR